ncbi:hypothetical protein GCM10023354_00970 [Garicola koreensis]
MAINFHDRDNAGTYATREADDNWRQAIGRIVDLDGLRVVDLGCGGGIYSTALAQMGSTQVIGVDSSAQMVQDARERAEAAGIPAITYQQGSAEQTGLPDGDADLVLKRALIHHRAEPSAAFAEAGGFFGPAGHCWCRTAPWPMSWCRPPPSICAVGSSNSSQDSWMSNPPGGPAATRPLTPGSAMPA